MSPTAAQRAIVNAALLCLLLAAGCAKHNLTPPDFKTPERNGAKVFELMRTPCFGKCATYEVTLYQNGMLIFSGKRFTDSIGQFGTYLSQREVKAVRKLFARAKFETMAPKYPTDKEAPSDLPSCIVVYHINEQEKTVRDKGGSPPALKELQKALDQLWQSKTLSRSQSERN